VRRTNKKTKKSADVSAPELVAPQNPRFTRLRHDLLVLYGVDVEERQRIDVRALAVSRNGTQSAAYQQLTRFNKLFERIERLAWRQPTCSTCKELFDCAECYRTSCADEKAEVHCSKCSGHPHSIVELTAADVFQCECTHTSNPRTSAAGDASWRRCVFPLALRANAPVPRSCAL